MKWARVHCLSLSLPFQTADKIPCFTILRNRKSILKHAHKKGGENYVVTHTLMYLTYRIKMLIHFNLHMIQVISKICKMHWQKIKNKYVV